MSASMRGSGVPATGSAGRDPYGQAARGTEVAEQAAELECLLPKLMRRLFALQDSPQPVAELPLAQLRLCTILQAGPRPMSILADELSISVSAVTQIADRLERAGLVERIPDADDRRSRLLRLTGSGAELMRARRARRVDHLAEILQRLEPCERKEAIRSLHALLRVSAVASAQIDDDVHTLLEPATLR
jgi:DNA-binding MarR family transcriptional regulator